MLREINRLQILGTGPRMTKTGDRLLVFDLGGTFYAPTAFTKHKSPVN